MKGIKGTKTEAKARADDADGGIGRTADLKHGERRKARIEARANP